MRVTAAEVAGLKRRHEQPVKAEGELLAIFVAGRLLNAMNDSGWIWQKRVKYVKGWKERVALAVLESGYRPFTDFRRKRVSFLANTHNAMDGDGLQAALKPVRDALMVAGVISGDADRDGHEFVYAQRIDRTRRGVEIRVSPRRQPTPAAGVTP